METALAGTESASGPALGKISKFENSFSAVLNIHQWKINFLLIYFLWFTIMSNIVLFDIVLCFHSLTYV